MANVKKTIKKRRDRKNIESGAAISQRSAAKVAKALNARVEDIFEITTK